jgi:broad specificity phosphatase PhoE
LNDERQQELAKLLTRLLASDEPFPELRERNRNRREWADSGSIRIKKLRKQIAAAHTSLAGLADSLKSLNIRGTSVESVLHSLVLLDAESLWHRLPPIVDEMSRSYQQETEDVLVTLHSWFIRQRIAKGDAEYRTGKISNEYWGTDFKLTERDKDTAAGCDAVRNRVRNRKRDTSNKSF